MRTLLPSRIVNDDLTIQRWTTADIVAMEALIVANLDHLRPWMAWAADEPIGPRRRQQLFNRWDRYWQTGNGAVYSVRIGPRLVGGCAVHRQSNTRSAEIGYWFAENATGRGVATRTARALTDAAFRAGHVDIVRISHERSNTRSAAVAERLGFRNVSTPSPKETRWQANQSRWKTSQIEEPCPDQNRI